MVTDPIADLLTRMRNAFSANQEKTVVPYSKAKIAILSVLKQYKFIVDFKVVKSGSFDEIEVLLNRELKEFNLKRVSKPGQRIYIKSDAIKSVYNGYGIAVLSTSKGVMSANQARRDGLGGEYLCQVW
ncbi:30S ribosomal protein S8 [Candidatus Peregrinibacteria bacterium CG_4_10_14_0_2_um_filter_43_11]|nr:MAG: 30S ribosomal protein S8 [Candidatus Peregrinibacteria bacterium CG_4_10_14_0_2_um_filter_43_11]